jgi:hypothetical protein
LSDQQLPREPTPDMQLPGIRLHDDQAADKRLDDLPQHAGKPEPGRAAHFARDHGLFGTLLLVAAAARAVAMLGYPGPLLYPDSGLYLFYAHYLSPGQLRPLGYSLMLRILEPLHSLAAVIIIQHAMGLCIGVLGYALLRRHKLPAWGATLAMVPVLLSAYAIQLEHFLLSDTLFAFLVTIAVVAMTWWKDPPLRACALAGLLLAAAALVRTQGVPLLIVFVIYLLIRFAGWRTVASVAALCIACAIPTSAYAAWFDHVHGSFNLTTSDGAFLYAETATFANCAVMNPPADERFLCQNAPMSERSATAVHYLFKLDPLGKLPGSIDGNRADKLGLDFALRAIRAQPLDYLRAVGENFAETFAPHGGHGRMNSVTSEGAQSELDYMFPMARQMYPLTNWDQTFLKYDAALPDEQVVHPFSTWIQAYQRYIVASGPLLGVILLTGLAGLIAGGRRRASPALLPWLTGVALLVIPATVLYDQRFVICAIPALCIAAALGVQRIRERTTAGTQATKPAAGSL